MNLKYLFAKLIKKMHLSALKESKIDKTSKICSGSHLVSCYVSKYTYIGNFCTILNAHIGSFCSIADFCIIGGASHPINWVSTSPVFIKGKNVLKKNFSEIDYVDIKETIIGNDVWIGNSCLIKAGVEISDGAIIGMGSILTKDVGPYEIWGGNPAKFIKKRFDDVTIERLMLLKWWELSSSCIEENSHLFNDVDLFLEKFKKMKSDKNEE